MTDPPKPADLSTGTEEVSSLEKVLVWLCLRFVLRSYSKLSIDKPRNLSMRSREALRSMLKLLDMVSRATHII
jgi:hypothetical protein